MINDFKDEACVGNPQVTYLGDRASHGLLGTHSRIPALYKYDNGMV